LPMVTLKDIAVAANVSVATASHILGTRGHNFRQETRDRVCGAAKSLGYRANASAKAMRSGRFNCYSLLLSMDPLNSGLFLPMINGISYAMEEDGIRMMISRVSDEHLADPDYVPTLLRECASDGLLVIYNVSVPDGLKTLMSRCGIPAIWLNSRQDSDCIYPDERDAGIRATEKLLELGHTDIAYLDYTFGSDYPHIHFHLAERYLGYEIAMRTAGLTPRRLDDVSGLPRNKRIAHSAAWLTSSAKPSAVVTRAATTAWPILHAAASLGIKVPEQLSVITFSERVRNDTGVQIDAMLVPMFEMGRPAVDALTKKIANPSLRLPAVQLPMKYQAGETCAPWSV